MNATMTTMIEIMVKHVVPPVFFLTPSKLFLDICVRSRLPARSVRQLDLDRQYC
jgi:hypothetical protein